MIADFVAAAATLWQYWNNPFLIRGFRSDWRGRSWVAAFILQFGVLASIVWIIGAIGSMAGPRGFAEWWGGSWGGLAIVLMSLAHFFMVRRGAAANRRRELLTDEARIGTLEPLLVTPMSRAEIILKSTVYPFLWASIVALTALPLYMICAAVGDVDLGAIAALYGLYLALAFRPPVRLRHSVVAHSVSQQVIAILAVGVLVIRALTSLRGGFWEAIHYGGILFTWVWELGLWLAEPFPFYAFHVPPVILLLLLYPVHLICGILMASAELEAEGRVYLEALTKLRFWYRVLIGLVAMGLIWEPVLIQGRLDTLLGLAGGPSAAFAFLLGAAVAVVGGSEVMETARTRLDILTGLGIRLRLGRSAAAHLTGGVLHAVSAVLLIPILHLVGCGLGAQEPYPPGSSLVLRSLVAAMSAIVLCYSIGILLWLLVAKRKWLYSAAYFACAALLIALPWLGLSVVGGSAGAALAALSPVATFAAMTGSGGGWFAGSATELPPASLCMMAQVGAGLILLCLAGLVLARRLGARRMAVPAGHPARSAAGLSARPSYFERLAQKWDNPITISTCRSAARSGSTLVAPILMAVAVLMAIATALTSPFTLRITPLFVYDAAAMAAPAWRVMGFVSMAGWAVACLTMALGCGTAFSDDRRRESFGFTLLSPLTAREIVDGRFVATALPVAYAAAIPVAISLVAAILTLSTVGVLHWLLNSLWMATVAAAIGYAALSGALGLTVSDVRGFGNALALLMGVELGRWTVCSISQAALKGAGLVGQIVGTLLAGLFAVTASAGLLLLCRTMAHGALRRLRERDPFAA